MRTVSFELAWCPASQNQWERTNPYKKPRIMLKLRDQILRQIKEGPWPKAYLQRHTAKVIREHITAELRKRWQKKRMVVAELNVRRPGRRLDDSNLHGGCKPLWDAVQWAGWCVSDHALWFKIVYRDQVLGDPKTLVQLWIPETDEEEGELKKRMSAGVRIWQ